MKTYSFGFALLLSFLFSSVDANAGDQIAASLIVDRQVFQPGKSSTDPVGRIGILLKIRQGWHTYWRNSGEAAMPTKVNWTLPSGWSVGELQWPVPKRFKERGNITTYGYTEEVLLFAPLFAPTLVPESDTKSVLKAKVNWLVCEETCVPGSASVEKEVIFSGSTAEGTGADYAVFEKYEALSPKPLAEFRQLDGISLEGHALSKDNAVTGLLRIRGLKTLSSLSSEELAQSIQLFPITQVPARLNGIPDGTVVPSKEGQDAFALIRVPVSFLPSPDERVLKGIAALGPKLAGGSNEVAFPFEISLTPAAVESTNASELKAVQDAVQFKTLSYHLEDRSGKEESEEPSKSAGSQPQAAVTAQPQTGILAALLLAFIGGLILNLMPCVLPIISIKIMGFVESGHQSRAAALRSSLFFSAGILASVLSLAAVIIAFRTLGFSFGWGFQFQYPSFVFALCVIVFLLGLSFFDLYSIELPGVNKANRFASALTSPNTRSFFDGVLATALSTPCTAPFLGTALVFAFAQPAWATVLVFLSIGVGLAFPYVLLSSSPKLSGLLPKPGVWMFRFRQFLGFLLMGTVVWLLFVLHALTNMGALWAVCFLLALFFTFWMIRGVGEHKVQPSAKRLLLAGVFLIFCFVKLYPLINLPARASQGPLAGEGWKPFSDQLVSSLRAEGKVVFVDFTASWCITCKTNELLVINTQETSAKMKEYGVEPLSADWTTGEESITAALKRYGAEGVPLYVILAPGDKAPIVLSGIITKTSLYSAFKQAAGK